MTAVERGWKSGYTRALCQMWRLSITRRIRKMSSFKIASLLQADRQPDRMAAHRT